MAMANRNEGSKISSDINVTPMVDVMLVLLIIFMVVTPLLVQPGVVPVDMAKTDHPLAMPDAQKEDALLVAITHDGMIYLGSDHVALDQLKVVESNAGAGRRAAVVGPPAPCYNPLCPVTAAR